MSYYVPQRGDYYGRGDPGFLSDIWKKVKKPLKIAGAYLVGGVPGASMMASSLTQAEPQFGFPGVGTVGKGVMTVPQNGAAMMNGCCPVGYHPDKRTGTKCVKNRRMNVANARALRRSMRRVSGFEKLAKRTISFTKRVRIKK